MAELKNGPLGTISGKVGNMVASNWRDISYLRSVSKKSTKEPTEAQKETQMKFNLLQSFLVQIKAVIDIGFGNKNTGRATALNLAFKANINSFAGTYPELELDLSSIKISTGSLVRVPDPVMTAGEVGQLKLTWTDLGNVAGQADTDVLHVMLYNKSKNLHLIYLKAAVRADLQAELNIPVSFSGDEVYGWIFLSTATGDKNSESIYLPAVTPA